MRLGLCCWVRARVFIQGFAALTAGTVMYNFMSKDVAVNAEVVMANCTFIPAADGHALDGPISHVPFISRRHSRERIATSKAADTS